MKRAWFGIVLLVGCAAQKAERAPSSAPASPASESGGAADKAGGDTSAPAPSMAPVPGSAGGGATGTVVAPEDVSKAQITLEDASKAFSAAGNDCAQLCKALHSMTHATDRLCELTQGGTMSDQQRCSDARSRLETAKSKVHSTCGTC